MYIYIYIYIYSVCVRVLASVRARACVCGINRYYLVVIPKRHINFMVICKVTNYF